MPVAMIGTQVLHFRILERLGEGGMGEVFLAEDTRLKRRVALKFLPPHYSTDREFKARFEHEAVAAAALSHPNIVTIYELAEHEGRLLIAMEYVEGHALRTLIDADGISLRLALDLACQTCEALVKAHAAGIVHRDIKPSNILVDTDGRAKILDFGLAKSVRATARSDAHTRLGTLLYASPEQILDEPVDHRADLFALGLVLYEMITGHRPFEHAHPEAVQYAVLSERPDPLARFRTDVPGALQRITDKLLAKSPSDRYQTASDCLVDLRQVRAERMPGAVTQDDGRRPPSIAVLPFNNLSAEPEQAYFCEGMAEEIINRLAKIRGLHVTARTSTFAYRDRPLDVRAIGRELGVATVLEGSVSRAGSRLRIWAQLIKVQDGFHLWSERYDREVADIFAIQDEIAGNIADALQLLLSDEEKRAIAKPPTSQVQAYDYYLQGRQYFHQGRRKGLVFARELFEQAINLDADFALAHAALAICCALLVHFYGESREAHVDLADRASTRALALDPELADAHVARGFALWLLNRTEESFASYERAIELDPKLFDARYFFARECFQMGDLERAADLFEQACQIQENHEARYFAAQTYSALHRPEAARAAYALALEAVQAYLELHPGDVRAVTIAAVSWCRLGNREQGFKWAERALAIDPDDAGVRYNVACLYALEGENERALECLEAAVAAGFAHRDWVEHDPDLDSLRDDPRFKALKWRDRN